MYKRNNESFLEHVLKEAKNNPNQIIIKDKWRSWTWNDIIKTSYRFSESEEVAKLYLQLLVVLLVEMHLHHYQLNIHRIE